jgi:chromate transport protein ChrA
MATPTSLRNLQPIVHHGLASATVALVGAGLITLCTTILPTRHAEQLLAIEQFVVIGAAALFAANTLLLLAVRIFRNIQSEVRGDSDVEKQAPPPSGD